MIGLSQDDCKTIAERPLANPLDHLRELLRHTEQAYASRSFSFDGAVDSSVQGPRITTSKPLLTTLMGHDVALDLRSKIADRNVASELASLVGQMRKGEFSYKQYRALSKLVINKAPEVDIWKVVCELNRAHKINTAADDPSSISPITHTIPTDALVFQHG